LGRTGRLLLTAALLFPGLSSAANEEATVNIDDIFFGWGQATPFWSGIEVTVTDIAATPLYVGTGFVASDDQGAIRFRVGIPVTWSLDGRYVDGEAFGLGTRSDYDRLGARVGVGFEVSSAVTLRLGYRAEGLTLAGGPDGPVSPRLGFESGNSLLSNAWLAANLDLTDEETGRTGFRVGTTVEASHSATGSDFEYVRALVHSEYGIPVGAGHALRFGLVGGRLFSDGDVPFFEGFYVGDVSGFVPPRSIEVQLTDRRLLDLLESNSDQVTYGDALVLGSVEWDIPLARSLGPLTDLRLYLIAGALAIAQGPWDTSEVVVDDELHGDLILGAGLRMETPLGALAFHLAGLVARSPP
jgi:outer membrane protein assembly factor BamA